MREKKGARRGDRAWTVRDMEGESRAAKGREMRVKKEWSKQGHWI